MAFPENTVNDIGIKHIWDKVTAALSGKVDKVSGKGLSTNDYTTAEKDKLAGIESGAQVNTVTSVAGKTGAVTLDKADVGLGNVDNTSDLDKPISTATQTALNNKADSGEVEGLKTATGNPITLTDASETYAQGLTVELEPKQDLHGYDFPWVGGAGKNKLDYDTYYASYKQSDGTFRLTGVQANNIFVYIPQSLVGKTVTFSVYLDLSKETGPSTASTRVSVNGTGSEGNKIYNGNTGFSSVTFTPQSTSDYVSVTYGSSGGNYLTMSELQLEEGSERTPWTSYENICPISGYEGVEVEDVGKNLFDASEIQAGYWDVFDDSVPFVASSTWQALPKMRCSSGENYTFSCKTNNLSGNIAFIDKNGKLISFVGGGSVMSRTVETPANCYLITAYFNAACTEIQLEKGTTATPYEPFKSRTASVTFGQTVYGGTVDFKMGKAIVTHVIKDLGSLNYVYRAPQYRTGLFSSGEFTDYKHKTNAYLICEDYNYIGTVNTVSVMNDKKNGSIALFYDGGSSSTIYIIDERYNDANAFKTALNGVKICYELAEPYTIQLTPQELKLLQDTNSITTNGTTITLDYIPNNSIGDAVKASEEYTDRAVERVIPKAKLACFYEIFDESGTLYDVNIPEDCNFFLVEYSIQNRIGSTLIKAKSIDFYIPVVVNVGGEQHWVEFLYNSIYHTIDYTSNVTTGFGVLSIYTI